MRYGARVCLSFAALSLAMLSGFDSKSAANPDNTFQVQAGVSAIAPDRTPPWLAGRSQNYSPVLRVADMTCGVYPNQFTCRSPTPQCCYRANRGYYCAKDLQSC